MNRILRIILFAILLVSLQTAWVPPVAAGGSLSLSIKTKHTSGSRPRPKAAENYAKAKKLLARGQAKLALQKLSKAPSKLLRDREALVRGDALMSLRQTGAAIKAYKSAIKHAQTKRIALRGARALVKALGSKRQRKQQLRYINVLLKEKELYRRASLLLEKVTVLEQLGRKHDAARTAWRILQDYPTDKIANTAEKHLQRLIDKGAKRPASSEKMELARIRNLWKSKSYKRALRALDKMSERAAHLERTIILEKADIAGHQRKTDEELKFLLKAEGMTLTSRQRTKALERIGRLYMRKDENDLAISYFTKLATQFPKSRRVPETQFLAAWLPYNSGEYSTAATSLLSFAQKYPKWIRRPEALWFAAWSGYLSKDYGIAKRALAQILEDHPNSEMSLWSYYWGGRIEEIQGKKERAKKKYREVLKIAPLGYWGHWSSSALTRLGEQVVLSPPPMTKIASIDQALRKMQKKRPITVDRGIALFEVGLENEAFDELRQASKSLSKLKNRRARIMVAEMLNQLGAHNQAFRMASQITKSGTDLASGEPYSWRAWRLAYPFAFEKHVKAAAKEHEVDPLLVLSIMRTESAFRPYVRSPVGARGLMQVMPATARRIGRTAKGGRKHANRYKQPASNIWLGTWYIKQLLKRYNQQLPLAISAYNAGPRPADRWLKVNAGRSIDEYTEAITYRETRRYTRRVLETYQTYRRLAGMKPYDLSQPLVEKAPPKGAVSF